LIYFHSYEDKMNIHAFESFKRFSR